MDAGVDNSILTFYEDKTSQCWWSLWSNYTWPQRCGDVFLHDLQVRCRQGVKSSLWNEWELQEVYPQCSQSVKRKWRSLGLTEKLFQILTSMSACKVWNVCFLGNATLSTFYVKKTVFIIVLSQPWISSRAPIYKGVMFKQQWAAKNKWEVDRFIKKNICYLLMTVVPTNACSVTIHINLPFKADSERGWGSSETTEVSWGFGSPSNFCLLQNLLALERQGNQNTIGAWLWLVVFLICHVIWFDWALMKGQR